MDRQEGNPFFKKKKYCRVTVRYFLREPKKRGRTHGHNNAAASRQKKFKFEVKIQKQETRIIN